MKKIWKQPANMQEDDPNGKGYYLFSLSMTLRQIVKGFKMQ